MHDDRISLGDLFEDVSGPPAGVHVVLGDDLEPIDSRVLPQDVRVVGGPQADPQTQVREPETLLWHVVLISRKGIARAAGKAPPGTIHRGVTSSGRGEPSSPP